jgi:hypothetical protein
LFSFFGRARTQVAHWAPDGRLAPGARVVNRFGAAAGPGGDVVGAGFAVGAGVEGDGESADGVGAPTVEGLDGDGRPEVTGPEPGSAWQAVTSSRATPSWAARRTGPTVNCRIDDAR